MDSDLQQQQFSHHFQLPKQQMNSNGGGGLTRYRSAPSSYFSAFMDAVDTTTVAGTGEFSQPQPQSQQPRPLSPETESILARFMQNVDEGGTGPALRPHKLYDIPENSQLIQQSQFMGSVKQETEQIQRLPSSSQTSFMSNLANINSIESSFRLPSSVAMNFSPSPLKLNSGSGRINSNLTRHRSSPAGLFDDIIVENVFLVNRETGTGNYGSGGRSCSNNQINFSSGESLMVAGNSDGGGGPRRFANGGDDRFMTNFQAGSWDDQSLFSDQFPGQETAAGDFESPENQNREGRNRPPGMLAHHMSLPSPSIEKLLQFQDAVPCKIRAKRGCATHPRSIAERVRRIKISERMKKLQDLVPNMDKQTNTSDMLDLAVEYIRDLQKQVKTLADNRDKCTCSSSLESGRR